MSRFNDDVVSDLQCRFSEGETPTWEEFYQWIEDIQAGFDAHNHSGAGSGDGGTIPFSGLSGLTEYENIRDNTGASAIVTAVGANASAISALQSAVIAVQGRLDDIENDYLVAADLSGHAGDPSAHHTRYTDGAAQLQIIADLLPGGYIDNGIDALILDHDGDNDAHGGVEAAYVIHAADASAHHIRYTNGEAQLQIIAELDPGAYIDNAIDALISDHATVSFDVHGVGSQSIAGTDDLGALDDRIGDIEADYTTANQAYVQGEYAFNDSIEDELSDHAALCGCYQQC